MLIKLVFSIFFVFLIMATASFAQNSCSDIKTVADVAIKNQNALVKANYNATIIDPAADRDSLLSCLSSINALGNMFTMNVHLPSFQSLLNKVCNKVDSEIQNKINEAMWQLEQTGTEHLGGINPFHVNIDGDRIVDDLIKNIH